jgi:hypothetical protein
MERYLARRAIGYDCQGALRLGGNHEKRYKVAERSVQPPAQLTPTADSSIWLGRSIEIRKPKPGVHQPYRLAVL